MSRHVNEETRQARPSRRNFLPQLAIERKKPTSRDVGFAYNLAVSKVRNRVYKWGERVVNLRLRGYAGKWWRTTNASAVTPSD